MSKISIVAQNLMDLYYQSFKSDEDFFELYHFEYLVSVAYAKLLQLDFEKAWKLNYQVEGIGYISVPSDWVKEVELQVKKDGSSKYVELPDQPFVFLYDNQNSGIQTVRPIGFSECNEFIRSAINQSWKLCRMPDVGIVYWMPVQKKIFFEKLNCRLDRVSVIYVPAIDLDKSHDFDIPKTKESDIIEWVLNIMRVARDGTVVDKTNDGNPNKVLQTEINDIFKNLKKQ